MGMAWRQVRQLQLTTGAAIVVWVCLKGDRRNAVFTNGEVLKLMQASRSVSNQLAQVEAQRFADYEATIEGSELEEAM